MAAGQAVNSPPLALLRNAAGMRVQVLALPTRRRDEAHVEETDRVGDLCEFFRVRGALGEGVEGVKAMFRGRPVDGAARVRDLRVAEGDLIVLVPASWEAPAAGGRSTPGEARANPAALRALLDLGFDAASSEKALIASGNDSNAAASLLLGGGPLDDAALLASAGGAQAQGPLAVFKQHPQWSTLRDRVRTVAEEDEAAPLLDMLADSAPTTLQVATAFPGMFCREMCDEGGSTSPRAGSAPRAADSECVDLTGEGEASAAAASTGAGPAAGTGDWWSDPSQGAVGTGGGAAAAAAAGVQEVTVEVTRAEHAQVLSLADMTGCSMEDALQAFVSADRDPNAAAALLLG